MPSGDNYPDISTMDTGPDEWEKAFNEFEKIKENEDDLDTNQASEPSEEELPADVTPEDNVSDSVSDINVYNTEEADAYETDVIKGVREQVINEILKSFVDNGEKRQSNGMLGRSVNDPEIRKVDSDGTVSYFNPETGRRFNGDNPRRQAQEWCDDYNRELADKFNSMCSKREAELMGEYRPRIETLKFKPVYEALDPVRQQMFDNAIQDYEIKDSDGDVIGYSCNLQGMLNMVNRQVAAIQRYASSQRGEPTSPSLDMKGTSGANAPKKRVPTSLAEAFEMQQDEILDNLRKGNM